MSTISLAYVSSAIHPMTNDALRDLLSSARKKNKGFDITGMLLYRDSFFIQVLEGEPEYVTIVYNRIKQDPRHNNVTLIYSESITDRAFDEWSMGFNILDDASLKNMEGFSNFLAKPSYEFFSTSLSDTKNLLFDFRGRTTF